MEEAFIMILKYYKPTPKNYQIRAIIFKIKYSGYTEQPGRELKATLLPFLQKFLQYRCLLTLTFQQLINGLDSAGIDASAYMLDFSSLILEMLGFKHETSDEFHEWYFCHQNKLIENVDPENDKEFQERAFDFYMDLVVKKKEMGRIFCGQGLKCI